MSNGEICRWAWENSRGHRWDLWLAEFLALMAAVPGVALILLRQGKGLTTPGWWTFPLDLVCGMLGFGVLLTATEIVHGREPEVLTVFVPFRREWRKKAFLLVLLLTAIGAVVSLYPDSIIRRGQEMMTANDWQSGQENWVELLEGYMEGEKLAQNGRLLGQVLHAPFSVLLFPLGYLLFLRPELTAGQIVKESVSTVVHNLGRVIGLLLRSYLLLLAGCVLIFLVIRGIFAVVFLVGLLAVWFPWSALAQAKLASEMIEVGPEEPWWART